LAALLKGAPAKSRDGSSYRISDAKSFGGAGVGGSAGVGLGFSAGLQEVDIRLKQSANRKTAETMVRRPASAESAARTFHIQDLI
jgi:hypothetical protein